MEKNRCNSCGEAPQKCSCKNKDFTKAVIEIDNPETLVLFRKVVIPASMGTEEQVPPAIGKYHNVVLHYEANKHTYLYSSDGIPTLLETDVSQEVLDKIGDLSTLLTTDKTSVVAAINELAGEIEEGDSNIVELTMEHYNFPVDNPQGIAVWLLDPNYIYINKTEDLSFVIDGTDIGYAHELEGIFLVTPTQDYQNRCSVIYFSCDGEQSLGEWSGVGTYATYDQSTGELVDSGSFLSEKQIKQTTGQHTNMMMSQKAITDALSALETRVTAPPSLYTLTGISTATWDTFGSIFNNTYFPASDDVTFTHATEGTVSIASLWEKINSGEEVLLRIPLQDISDVTANLVEEGYFKVNPEREITVKLGPQNYYVHNNGESGYMVESTSFVPTNGEARPESFLVGIAKFTHEGTDFYVFMTSLRQDKPDFN